MRIVQGHEAAKCVDELASRGKGVAKYEPEVRRIVDDVRRRGDRALRKYAEKWDALGAKSLRVGAAEIRKAPAKVSGNLLEAARQAAKSIRSFAERQKPVEWMRARNGIAVGQVVRALDSAGCYIPGGRYPLLSTLLMTVIPAQVAGVGRVCVASPNPRPELLAIAQELGVDEFYRIGGAQAIAALAYGTESIARVDKIVGPGNSYVTAAKKVVAFDCAIDMLAGPTEVVVVSHEGEPAWIASDLVAQAEHDPEAIAIFITASRKLAGEVCTAVWGRSEGNAIARQSLKRNGYALVARSRGQAMDWANEIAPEHITVADQDLAFVRNAGSVFVGDYSPQAAGDYATGPNHVLPTGGAARFRGGLSVFDFLKLMTVQRLSRVGLRRTATVITALAEAEGLRAHADSVRARYQDA
jgi:histidinol dehydrogenase